MKKNILLGITGSIAAYKIPFLIRMLVKNNFNVKCILTEAAENFVTRKTLAQLSGNRVYSEMFPQNNEEISDDYHISLAEWADGMLIAPITADTIAKIASGRCEDLLCSTVISLWDKPIIIAPAMNEAMWKHPATQSNIIRLKKNFKYIVIPPEKGELACGKSGEGRLANLDKILSVVKSTFK